MHPLCVTLKPQTPTEVCKKNLENFINSGFDHILISADESIRRKFVKKSTIEFGDPFTPYKYGQLATPIRIAVNFNIPLIIYGEDGDMEYGGSLRYTDKTDFDYDCCILYRLCWAPTNSGCRSHI